MVRDGLSAAWGGMSFSPDGRLLGVGGPTLIDVSIGRQLATLDEAGQVPVVFSRDGTQLVDALAGGSVHVWDLRLLREQLSAMGLDWDIPAYPPSSEPRNLPPIRVAATQPGPATNESADMEQSQRELGNGPSTRSAPD